MHPPLIEALLQPSAYSHPVDYTKLLETHISWVILTGQYAYKIKKPVDFGFIDYSTLEKRHYYCEEEILLNHALAPQIYRQVLPITKTAEGYQVNGNGELVEYAVQMTEFSQNQLLSRVVPQHGLNTAIVTNLAKQLAHYHLQAPHSGADTPFGTPEVIQRFVDQNFSQARELLQYFSIATAEYLAPLEKLEAYSLLEFKKNETTILQRKKHGFVRSCHGDLRLDNITLINGDPVIFDCVEFNDELRWTDVMGDVGFLTMDFYDYKRPDYAMIFLNTYFTYTGDYAALTVLPYYFAYRAMVRAKIQLFNIQPHDTEEVRQAYFAKYANYVKLATHYLAERRPSIIIMHGFSGSGKSTLASRLAEALGAIVIRSDAERKRLFDLKPEDDSHTLINGKLYQPEITQRTYAQLKLLAVQILQAGYPVIIDATCLQAWQRQLFMDLAAEQSTPFVIVDCKADEQTLTARLENADNSTRFFSEADKKVLQGQLKMDEPLNADELAHAVTVNTDEDFSISKVSSSMHGILYGDVPSRGDP